MKRNEILNMPAGPQMDLLVGENVLHLTVKEWNIRFMAWQTSYSTNMNNAWIIKNKMMQEYPESFVKVIRSLIRAKIDEDSITTIEVLQYLDAEMICRAALLTVMETE